jgi:diguanylate cyclase (GGDEF)-like protein
VNTSPGDENRDSHASKESLFLKRIAELQSRHNLLPWQAGEFAHLTIPANQSCLAAERAAEDEEISNEELEKRVLLDLVSQTYNFRTFFKRLNYELRRAQRYERTLSLCLVGIDKLAEITNSYGETALNSIVQAVGKTLINSVRDVDVLGRCREDVFGIILPETSVYNAEVAAERIATQLESLTVNHLWQKFKITARLSIACFPGKAHNADELFLQALQLLFQSGKADNRINSPYCEN